MKTTTLSEFREALLKTGAYHTAPDHCAEKRASKSFWTTLRLSYNVSRVFPFCGVLEAFGVLNTDKWAELCFSSVTGAEALGIHVNLEGFENRAAYKGPVVYLCNHMSTYETIMLPPVALTFGPFCVVAKNSLGHLPGLEKAAAHMGMVTVGRKSPREDLMHILTVGKERIGQGSSFLIFPQGSRQKMFSRQIYSSIGAKLAEKAGCPVCPLVVDTRCMPTREGGGAFKDFGTVDTSFDIKCACGPIIADPKAKVMHEKAFDWMAAKLESWGLPTEH